MYNAEPTSIAITNATVVQPEGLIECGAVGIAGGRIVEAGPSGSLRRAYDQTINAEGAYLMPGVVDLHNDSLEVEINPRPETSLPVEFALANSDRRLLFSGITTEFHAISFMNNKSNGRTVANAAQRADRVREFIDDGRQLIANNVLHRLDVWTPDSLDYIFASMAQMPVRYVSINDHTPGQGQYRDLDAYRERMQAWSDTRGRKMGMDNVDERINQRASDTETLPYVYRRIAEEMERSPFIIASHDDDSAAKVEALYELGARVSEFPVTLDAAERARELAMSIVVGAPNIVRGGSSSGNMDAADLFRRGLADVICADYHAPSMLPAAFRLVRDGILDLPAAVRALSLNPARAIGLNDLGAVLPGYIADLLLVRQAGTDVPSVERAFRDGREVLTLRPSQRVEVTA